jgi:hypothetical protein
VQTPENERLCRHAADNRWIDLVECPRNGQCAAADQLAGFEQRVFFGPGRAREQQAVRAVIHRELGTVKRVRDRPDGDDPAALGER